MTRILIIDDEPLFHKMIEHTLKPLGYELVFALDGAQGLRSANATPPDLIICDVMMPNMSGYEVTRQLRRDPRFAQTPIMILTAQSDLKEKIEAFEAGADDHMTKPFAPPELIARINNLLRRFEPVHGLKMLPSPTQARLIAVHSLRGGTGCSSIAINIGICLVNLWQLPTLLADQVLTAGQVALMLNASLKRTWSDISKVKPDELDWESLQSIIGKHESGLNFIAAPTNPSEADLLTGELFTRAYTLLRTQFEYMIVDLPHDFGGASIEILDMADEIVVLLAPEMASIRAAAAALDTYRKLDYNEDKIKLVLNWTFERKGLLRKNIETALHHSIELVLPFTPDLFVEAINFGRPILQSKPNDALSDMIERFSFRLSKPEHMSNVPAYHKK
jgi:pilus assembly protein CpaE